MNDLIRLECGSKTFGGSFDPNLIRFKDGGLSTSCLTDVLVEHSQSQAAAKLVQASYDLPIERVSAKDSYTAGSNAVKWKAS